MTDVALSKPDSKAGKLQRRTFQLDVVTSLTAPRCPTNSSELTAVM
jgi:hypothetical protein